MERTVLNERLFRRVGAAVLTAVASADEKLECNGEGVVVEHDEQASSAEVRAGSMTDRKGLSLMARTRGYGEDTGWLRQESPPIEIKYDGAALSEDRRGSGGRYRHNTSNKRKWTPSSYCKSTRNNRIDQLHSRQLLGQDRKADPYTQLRNAAHFGGIQPPIAHK